MAEIGRYIYGIINSTPHFLMGSGVNGTYPVSCQDISAVVSDSEIVDYTCILKDTLARLLLRHQEVIEKIMGLGYAIVPVKLGTFALNENEVKDILNKGDSLIRHIFEKINDKIEIDVTATWNDFTSVLKEVGEEKEVKEFKENLLANPKGITAYEQMKVGTMVKNGLDRKRESSVLEIQNYLKNYCEDIKIHELMDDKMVINAAFLLNKDKKDKFEGVLDELNKKFDEKINFRCVGPLPVYSFYTIEIKKMRFEEINWAREKLNLAEDATQSEIKNAYRNLGLSSHPDRNPDKPEANMWFEEITRAHKILLDYCQSERCSFKKEEFDRNSIIIKIRG